MFEKNLYYIFYTFKQNHHFILKYKIKFDLA